MPDGAGKHVHWLTFGRSISQNVSSAREMNKLTRSFWENVTTHPEKKRGYRVSCSLFSLHFYGRSSLHSSLTLPILNFHCYAPNPLQIGRTLKYRQCRPRSSATNLLYFVTILVPRQEADVVQVTMVLPWKTWLFWRELV